MTKTNRSRVARPGLRTAGRRARRGFTLIELLVAMAIMAVLASLITAAIQKVRVSRMARDTEGTVVKVQNAIDHQVDAINDQVVRDARDRTADFQRLTAFCDGDEARAAALLTYCRIKQNFPQTAAEAASPGFSIGGVNFFRPVVFAPLANINGPDANHVSAALLCAAISNRSLQGSTSLGDTLTARSITIGGVPHNVYLDSWDNPVGFRRFHRSTELNSPEYANTKTGRLNPIDPAGKLASWGNTASKQFAEQQLGITFTNDNTAVVAYSAGNNKAYDNLTGDDILGYRLRKIGGRGAP